MLMQKRENDKIMIKAITKEEDNVKKKRWKKV